MALKSIVSSFQIRQSQSEQAYDYVLARVETSRTPSTLKGYVVRKYVHGKADITQTPLREMRAPTIGELEDKIVPNNCVNWGINDQIMGYRGQKIAEDQKLSLCPVTDEELRAYVNLLKEVKLRLR